MRVLVVGAGISGLTLAYTLMKRGEPAGIRATVLEGTDRAGGVVRSERVEGFLCEHGPNGFLDGAEDTLTLVDELGIRDRLVPSSDAARRRFVFRAGRLRPLPTGPGSFLGGDILSLGGRLRMMLEPLIRGGSQPDESVHSFVSRRFGREAADVMADALTTGIFGGGARELSIRACLPQVWQLEAEYGGVIRGLIRKRRATRAAGEATEVARKPAGPSMGRLTSLANGIEDLLTALAEVLDHRLRTRVAVERIDRDPSTGGWRVLAEGGEVFEADQVVIATGADRAARLLGAVDRELAGRLAGIPWAPLAVLCLGYAASDARFDGFGFLAPRGEGLRILGAVWDSSIFPNRAPADHVLVRVLIGGGSDPHAPAMDDASLIALARADLSRACGLQAPPRFTRVVRQVPGLPQYRVGHTAGIDAITRLLERHPGLSLIGNSYRGLALNACIADARHLAGTLVGAAGTSAAIPGNRRPV
jgi:oxygen-dependent protoporphyrinogen oxidase